MSSEKSQEVLSCDASIMKNVWEIRVRDYAQKVQQEDERKEKSALTSINKEWASRLASRQGQYKRVERKPKRVEIQTDNDSVWKSKPQVPPTLPRGVGSAPLGRPGAQSRGFSSPASNSKDKKGQDKTLRKLQLLMFLTQNQPSTMVWGKSWKYNKSLPVPEGNEAKSNWGQCWMFATQQPYSEPGKPWVNGPNMMDPHNLHLWMKTDYRMVESEELDLSLPTDEWQMSWRKSVKNNNKKDACGEDGANFGFFTTLVESQHHNEALCSSEWSDSWRSTKPASEQHDFMVPDDGLMNVYKQNMDTEMSSKWEECWKLVNQHGCNKSQLTQVKKSCSPEWSSSWRAATVVPNNQKNPESSLRQDHSDICDDRSQQRESPLHKVMLASREMNHRDLYLQLCNEFMALSEWSKAWQVTKNNSKPCEEIEKILKASPPRMETTTEAKKVDNNQKGNYSTSEKEDLRYEQLKHDVIYRPKREFAQSKMQHLKHLENSLSSSEWRDSWKALKHRMRTERRRMRPDPSRPFRASDKGGDMKPSASEWKDSWKFNCKPLRQEPEQWQQGWPTMPRMRVDRARDQNHFAPVVLPNNGPTGEPGWMESWRISRRQHQPGQGRPQTSQARSSVASHHCGDSRAHRRRSVSDWQMAWMVSETEFHHDRPSLTQWRDAWRWSVFEREELVEQVSRENQVDVLMEIQPQREKISLQRAAAKMSWSFDNQMFRKRYPEKEWNTSWRAESLLNLRHCGSSGKSMSCTAQQQHTSANGPGSKWGMSFRLANPMPNMDQPWVESSPNPCHYTVMWSRGKKMQKDINTNFSNNPATFRIWVNSHRFLQGSSAQIQGRTTSKKPVDPRVIMTNKTKSRKHLYSKIEEEKQSQRGWAGCHLLGKTQPRQKRGTAAVKVVQMEDKTSDKFFEEWAESWRFLVRPGALKKQSPVKSLTGWDDSWKFLIPPFQPMNGPKAK